MSTAKPHKKRMLQAPKQERRKLRSGPQPEVLKLEGDWQEAIKNSFQKKKPVGGWPK